MKMANVIIGVIAAVILIFGGGTGGYFIGRGSVKPEIVTNTVIYDIENNTEMRNYMNVENNMIQSVEMFPNLSFVITNHTTNTVTNWTRSTNWITTTNRH